MLSWSTNLSVTPQYLIQSIYQYHHVNLLLLIEFNICFKTGIGACIVLPFLLHQIQTNGFHHTICSSEWLHYPVVVLTISIFIFSKIPELMDTVWLALKKREIILLHWYHHITVLLFCWWVGFHTVGSLGLIFAGMNMFVHAIMYGYYALGAIGFKPPFPIIITLFQIIQMMIGTYVVYRYCKVVIISGRHSCL